MNMMENIKYLSLQAGLDSINADMGLAEKALKAMDLACGIFPKFWKKSEGFKEDDAIWGQQKGGGGGAPPPQGIEIPSGAFVAKITNDDREVEMEENMEQVINIRIKLTFQKKLDHRHTDVCAAFLQLYENRKAENRNELHVKLYSGERHGGQHQEHGQ